MNNIELRKKALATALGSTIALTSFAGCGNKVVRESVPTVSSETTISLTNETTKEVAKEEKKVELTKDIASEDYMIHAKAVAKAMYDNNKEYFDEKQYTIEDLENVYYLMNGKYYNSNKEIIMDKPQLDRSFDIVRELVMPQRVNEMLQKFSDLEHKRISEKEYFDEAKASKFYDYRVNLANFIDVNEKNDDLRKFVSDYSVEMLKVTENIKNGVSPEDHLKEFFSKVRSAQTGNITDYNNINNYLQENTTEDGYGFTVAAIYKATADYLNTVIDGHFVEVPTKDGKENVRIGYNYKEQILVNAYYLGDLVQTKDILAAKELIAKEFQTMPFDVMCYREDKVNTNFGYTPVERNTKTYTR